MPKKRPYLIGSSSASRFTRLDVVVVREAEALGILVVEVTEGLTRGLTMTTRIILAMAMMTATIFQKEDVTDA